MRWTVGGHVAAVIGSVVMLVAFDAHGIVAPSQAQDLQDVRRARDAPAQSFWSFLKPGQVVARCAESSPAHREATAALEKLDERIEALKPTDPAGTLIDELHALLRSECFLLAAEIHRVPRPGTSLSLRHWWIESSGRDWLASFLDLPRAGSMDVVRPHIVVPPDVVKTLTLDSHRDHPLRSLLCAAGDVACGAVTKGWKLRAEAAFETHRALGRDQGWPSEEQKSSDPAIVSRECAAASSAKETALRYQAWRACLEERRPRRRALPLGELRAPTTGWFVVAGRRGHYEFCDTTRAYDLATGAAFVDDSCSGLVLEDDGAVDVGATNRARKERVRAGAVPVDHLREAVWMILFRGETAQVQTDASYYPLPDGLVPQITIREIEPHDASMGLWVSTAQTSLTWRWMPPSGPAIAGELTWPSSSDGAETHAASLLEVAEESFVEGCASQRPPDAAMFRAGAAIALNDVSDESVEELRADVTKSVAKWQTLATCQPAIR